MKNLIKISLALVFLPCMLANAQSDSKCFRADWLQGERTISFTNEPLTDQGQKRVFLTLMNGAGPREKFKVGTHSAQTEGATGIYQVTINAFADGKQSGTQFYGVYMGNTKLDNKPTGEVKITNVTADTVNGEVNLTERDTSIKGTFTAKIPAATN